MLKNEDLMRMRFLVEAYGDESDWRSLARIVLTIFGQLPQPPHPKATKPKEEDLVEHYRKILNGEAS